MAEAREIPVIDYYAYILRQGAPKLQMPIGRTTAIGIPPATGGPPKRCSNIWNNTRRYARIAGRASGPSRNERSERRFRPGVVVPTSL